MNILKFTKQLLCCRTLILDILKHMVFAHPDYTLAFLGAICIINAGSLLVALQQAWYARQITKSVISLWRLR